MKCFIFCSAKIENYDWLKGYDLSDAFIICADGGIKHLHPLNLTADVWLGDGDSLKELNPCAKQIIKYPTKKDNTDTDLAVMYALENGFDEIYIIGAIGGRVDHEYSHFCLLKKIVDFGATGYLVDEKNTVFMSNKSFKLECNEKEYVSFFPFGGDVTGFSVRNMQYEAENITLKCGLVQASSNKFLQGKTADITFDKGYVLTICSND